MHILTLLLFTYVSAIQDCLQEKRFLKYFKARACFKSTLPTISWKSVTTVEECMKISRIKNGLAFNFSPPQDNITFFLRNCQILACPETENDSSTLIFDPTFDYYTAFGDFNTTVNATCVRSLGLFQIVLEKRNYTEAVRFCQNNGADLADILSESRTNTLAAMLQPMPNWYKAAYVGLDDLRVEKKFETPMGNFLKCGKFRAWAPGHPRPNRSKEDCVILDADRSWRAINCKAKLPFICEFYPSAPLLSFSGAMNANCAKLKNKRRRRQCFANNELFQVYNSSSRIDQCALWNDF